MTRWLIRGLLALTALLLVVALSAWLWLRASLPLLDGEVVLAGLHASVSVTRDAVGVVTVRAADPLDLARATGFVHAQERFFQMDLLRRSATGEVAALVGGDAVGYDLARRRHGFRTVAEQVLRNAPEAEQALLAAYADGVNAGLAALDAYPFEYAMLRVQPEAWRPEDSILVVHAMYFDLHDEDARRERYLAALHERFPPQFVKFLVPPGTNWDAPIVGKAFSPPPIPSPEVIDFRHRDTRKNPASADMTETLVPGSNSWAVNGSLSVSGAPIVANDMHLGHGVPNIWFRMRLELAAPDGFAVTGVSLPGVPAIVAGSNGRIAWGFTNSYGDWMDTVRLDTRGCNDGYRVREGCEKFERVKTRIEVAHGDVQVFELLRTRWGPVIESASNGGTVLHAQRWTAHDPAATNLELRQLAMADDVFDALAVAHAAGIPPQNLVVADTAGNIAWTLIGRIPRRVNHDGTLPLDSATTGKVWDGWLSPAEYPVIVNPPHGRLWTANARVVDGEMLDVMGDGGYALGARASQIRDRLFAQERFDVQDMLRIQLDDEARFLARWQRLLSDLIDPAAIAQLPERARLRAVLDTWEGRAAVESVAYRLVRGFRDTALSTVFGGFAGDMAADFPGFGLGAFSQAEGPLWQLVTAKPPHLLPPGYDSWRVLLLHAADGAAGKMSAQGALEERTWGERNTVRVRHALGGLPVLGLLLNAEARPLPGDNHMPRVQGRSFGASERFAVSPGREASGYFHMPGGQSGHPLSPFYLSGHEAWETGVPTPFLPGDTVHELALLPKGSIE